MKYEQIKEGVVKRTQKRVVGVFIDGTGLDRATRRINRKVEISALVRGVCTGLPPAVARYYTIIPYEDDARQHAFLDAVSKAGLNVVIKRLPPKGVNRQVSVDVEMGADIIAFALGRTKFGELSLYKPYNPLEEMEEKRGPRSTINPMLRRGAVAHSKVAHPKGSEALEHSKEPQIEATQAKETESAPALSEEKTSESIQRVVAVVCPGRDLSYPIALARELGADTVTADFGQFNAGDILKSAAKWIDLSDSETIWRD